MKDISKREDRVTMLGIWTQDNLWRTAADVPLIVRIGQYNTLPMNVRNEDRPMGLNAPLVEH